MASEVAEVEVFSRPGCHLCDDVVEAIRSSSVADRLRLRIINVDDDPELAARYGEEIPVVWIDGVKAFKYRCTAIEFADRFLRRRGER